MKTGLKKKEKFTRIYFNESSNTVDIFTHNSALKRRLREYCGKYSEAEHLIQQDEFGGAQYEIAKGRFSVRITAPYSDERRKNASDLARKNRNAERLNGNADEKNTGVCKKSGDTGDSGDSPHCKRDCGRGLSPVSDDLSPLLSPDTNKKDSLPIRTASGFAQLSPLSPEK